jgi:mono/diheme cytochrome c family protein
MNIGKLTLFAAFIIGVAAAGSGSPYAATGDGKQAGVTFEGDIAPIFRNKCQACHRPGGGAPMSLIGYAEARPWARAIKEKVLSRTMPPFFAAGPSGYFENDTRLTKEEIELVARWVDAGAPRGTPPRAQRNASAAAPITEHKADIMLKVPKSYTVRNDGIDDWQLFAFDYVFEEDTWVRGISIQPGNRPAVHHIGLYILPEKLKANADGRVEGGGADTLVMGGQLLLFWNPGGLARMYKEGSAILLPKGSRLGIQVHYAATTAEHVVDQSAVALYLANGVVNKRVRVLYGEQSKKIQIPAGEQHYELTDYKKFKTDAVITTFSAHMHLRGKSFIISLIYPDGRKETVFELPRFYFSWQRAYTLATPLAVPKGTVAEYKAVWDNSPQNPYNPDPQQVVHFGVKTTDEMMGGSIVYLIPDEELGIRVRNGVRIGGGESTSTNK